MAVRSVVRHEPWTISPDRTPGASGPVYEVECTTCMDRSDAEEQRTPPEDWALRHAGRNHDHRSYRAIITSFIRVTPAPGNPLYEEAL
ncbi:DUF7848 domain-containing protein [Streptomyces sp. BE230]|uniref:DUF7848 domain-containing protein n=1 Tax=Streptomyces sp. BE230 TaxID=3002526 RepID=UPI002ED50FCD|nr:hypothetical protein [Streptomyces sp. BE230]